MSDFDDYMAEAYARMIDRHLGFEPPSGEDAEPLQPVRKFGASMMVSAELLGGPAFPAIPLTRRQRFRWWRQDKIMAVRVRLASVVAGFDVSG